MSYKQIILIICFGALMVAIALIYQPKPTPASELKNQIEDATKHIKKLERVIREQEVERSLLRDTVIIIKKTIIQHENTYIQDIIDITTLNQFEQDSLYDVYSTEFDRQFTEGQFLPKR